MSLGEWITEKYLTLFGQEAGPCSYYLFNWSTQVNSSYSLYSKWFVETAVSIDDFLRTLTQCAAVAKIGRDNQEGCQKQNENYYPTLLTLMENFKWNSLFSSSCSAFRKFLVHLETSVKLSTQSMIRCGNSNSGRIGAVLGQAGEPSSQKWNKMIAFLIEKTKLKKSLNKTYKNTEV